MRLSHCRSPWSVLPMLGAALALLTVSLAGAGTLEGGRLVRTGRSAQRLEAADGIPHSHEQDEPDSSLAGLIVDGAGPATALAGVHAAPPGQTWNSRTARHGPTSQLVWPVHTPALAGAPPGPSIRLAHHGARPLSAHSVRPSLGRAPPTA